MRHVARTAAKKSGPARKKTPAARKSWLDSNWSEPDGIILPPVRWIVRLIARPTESERRPPGRVDLCILLRLTFWAAATALSFRLQGTCTGVALSIAGLVGFAVIAVHHLQTIIDRSAFVRSVERSVVLAVLNLIELVLIVGLWIRTRAGGPVPGSLGQAFDVVTLRSSIGGRGDWQLRVADILGTAGALLIFGFVLAALISAVGDRLKDKKC